MKKIIFALAVVITIMQACQKKTLPTISTRTSEPTRPVTAMVDVKPDIGTGKIIFTNRCGRCHALPDPLQYSTQRWEGILKIMSRRARLDQAQEIHVTAYIKANCAK